MTNPASPESVLPPGFNYRKGLPYAPLAEDLSAKWPWLSIRPFFEIGLVSIAIVLIGLHIPSESLRTAAAVLLIALVFVFEFRIARRFMAENAKLLEAMNRGQVDAAIDGFHGIAKSSATEENRSIALSNLAVALSLRGDHDAALGVVAYAESRGSRSRKNTQSQALALNSADLFALIGQPDEAELWIEESRRRGISSELLASSRTPVLIHLRRKHPAEALVEIDRRWNVWVTTLPAEAMRPMRVLKAFALHQAQRPADEVDEALNGTRPHAAFEYGGMATRWPELQSFLAKKGLS